MDSTTIVWIVAVIAAVIVIAALVFAARSRRNRRKHIEAERMREDITTHMTKVDKRQALADETEAHAKAAAAEAEAKAAEAARLKDRAADHRDAVAASRDDIEDRLKRADQMDPKTKGHDEARDNEEAEQEAARQRAERG
jgi:FtsZ-interacting cell division protein ZipA